MRYLIIILILTCVCFSQQEPEGAPMRDTTWCYIALRAPSGKVVRTVRVVERVRTGVPGHDMPVGFDTVRDSVLRVGCPTCGSDRFFLETFVTNAELYKPKLDPSVLDKYERRYGSPTAALAMQLLDFALGLDLAVQSARYSTCSECGTVYHGRRK